MPLSSPWSLEASREKLDGNSVAVTAMISQHVASVEGGKKAGRVALIGHSWVKFKA